MPNTPKGKTGGEPSVYSAMSFETLLKKFEQSECGADAFSMASWMITKYPEQALKLLPINFAQDETIKRLDFNCDNATSVHEWAAALLAAKKLKLEGGIQLPAITVDKVIENAQQIYNAERRNPGVCSPIK